MFGLSSNGILLGSGILTATGNSLYMNGALAGGSSSSSTADISGYFYPLFTYANAEYILKSGDSNNIIRFTGEEFTPILVSCPNYLPVGFRTLCIQDGSGQVVFSGSDGAIVQSRDQYTGTLGPYSEATITVKSNTAGNNAVYNLIGDIT